jgi:hypothetical protein
MEIALCIQIIFQAILSTDGRASFVALVYESEGLSAIQRLNGIKLVGFDAGDGIRSASVLSLGFSSIETLTRLNIFRIDGMYNGR